MVVGSMRRGGMLQVLMLITHEELPEVSSLGTSTGALPAAPSW